MQTQPKKLNFTKMPRYLGIESEREKYFIHNSLPAQNNPTQFS